MQDVESFFDSPDGTRGEIMRATYRALSTHGYADLTIQRIGEEFPKSKSLIYHHYDGKDDLLVDFLAFMLERYEATMPFEEPSGADEHLEAILDYVFATPLPDRRREFVGAMLELRAQAPHDEAYREHFTRHDRFVADRVREIIEYGIEEGAFRDVNPDAVAAFLLAAFNGSMLRRVTSEDDDAAAVREELDAYLRATLLPED